MAVSSGPGYRFQPSSPCVFITMKCVCMNSVTERERQDYDTHMAKNNTAQHNK